MSVKPGDHVEVSMFRLDGSIQWEPAIISRWTREMGGRASLPPGYEPVRFRDGTTVMIPAARMRLATEGGTR